MTSETQEQLLGYLLDALEAGEREEVRQRLEREPDLRSELQRLRQSLAVLDAECDQQAPPPGLASRTCAFVESQRRRTRQVVAAGASLLGGWRLQDTLVAAAIAMAATLLLFPAVGYSRFHAGVRGCQDNLRSVGSALALFSEHHGTSFPDVAQERVNLVGFYGPLLLEHGFLTDEGRLICPAAALRRDAPLRIPTAAEIRRATPQRLAELKYTMGGDYGYTLGIVIDGRYYPVKNLGRNTFAVMADAPSPLLDGGPSANHGGRGQNVLFESGRVRYFRICNASGVCRDYFVNNNDRVAPGTHLHDSVVGPSHAAVPILQVVERK